MTLSTILVSCCLALFTSRWYITIIVFQPNVLKSETVFYHHVKGIDHIFKLHYKRGTVHYYKDNKAFTYLVSRAYHPVNQCRRTLRISTPYLSPVVSLNVEYAPEHP